MKLTNSPLSFSILIDYDLNVDRNKKNLYLVN